MKEMFIVIKEQVLNLRIIAQMSRYEEKATYQNHYLGLIWQILNPLIQIIIYYLVFGLGVNDGRKINGVPYIVWMLIGITTWFFINSSILGASNSIFKNVGLVSKMKFPVSILPSISIVSNLTNYLWMTIVAVVALFGFGFRPTVYWFQLFYYLAAMIIFLFAFGILNATLTTLVRDYHIMLQSILRVVFFVSGPIWDIENKNLPVGLVKLLKLNPIYYLIEGFRDSYLSREWFWQKGNYTIIFWLMVTILLLIGSHVHLKFRAKFVDYI